MQATKLEVVSSNGTRNPVYNSIRRFCVDGLGDLIRVLMENVDDALFGLSDKVDNDRERNMYFEAMREIRLKSDALKRQFDKEMKKCFDEAISGKSADSPDEDDTELTLVEYDDLEDNIAIRNMVTRARPQFEDELFAVSERLKLVMKRDSLEADDNPLDPKAICNSFHNASDLLETDIQVKLIFYKLFERFVISNLGHFYREVNELFVRKGVLPGFKPDQERMKQTTRFMANRIKGNPGAQTTGGHAVVTGEHAVITGEHAVVNTTGEHAPVAGGLFGSLQQALGRAVQQSPGAAAQSGTAAAPAAGMYSTGEFANALGSLQTVSFADQPVGEIDPQTVRTANRQQLQAFREQNRDQVSNNDSQTIDVVSMLFDFFFDDEALPAPIKVLIGRLQIPILKVAIIDKDFFNHKKHPARRLLDSISRASLGWSENGADEKALIAKTEQIVNYLINEFDDDIRVFEKACASFEKFVRRQESESEKALQELALKEQEKDRQIETARAAAERLIAKLTRNRELSFEIIDFLETTWSSVLFNAYLSLGEKSNHWRNLKRISTTFVWTLIPKHTEAERVKIIKTIPALLRALSKGMELVNIRTEVQNRIFQTLAAEHSRIVKLTSKNIVTRVDDTTVWPEDKGAEAFARAQGIDPAEAPDLEVTTDSAGEAQIVENEVDDDSITIISAAPTDDVIDDLNRFAVGVKQGKIKVDEEIVMESAEDDDFDLLEADADCLALAESIEIGTWVEFVESSSSTLIARLSWKSNVSGNLVFVNRQGHKVRNLTTRAFAQELGAGRARGVESSSVFDRAINTIMTRMQH